MSSVSGGVTGLAQTGGSSVPPLSTIVYSSRAVTPFSDTELQKLMQTAQARNHAEGVTGIVLYDNSRFFQWIEGPTHGVKRIMDSIRNDQRHTDLRVLTDCVSTDRRFGGWDMKLAAQGTDPSVWRGDILEPPSEVIDDLNRQPSAAPTLLVKLVPAPHPAAGESPLAESLKGVALHNETAKILKNVILRKVIPRLLNSHGVPAAAAKKLQLNHRASELADLLVATDQTASLALIRELRADHPDGTHLFAPLLEPAARSLGDMWADDVVSEFELTLGLCRLQSAVRLLSADTPRAVLRSGQPKVMIAPAPGELHQLVSALDSESLWSEGWESKSEFPIDDRALTDLLSTTWVDILDLSLSAAFRREESLTTLTKSIVQARHASLNPNVLVVVGGRAFVEDRTVGLVVGADLASATSMNVGRLMAQGLRSANGD